MDITIERPLGALQQIGVILDSHSSLVFNMIIKVPSDDIPAPIPGPKKESSLAACILNHTDRNPKMKDTPTAAMRSGWMVTKWN